MYTEGWKAHIYQKPDRLGKFIVFWRWITIGEREYIGRGGGLKRVKDGVMWDENDLILLPDEAFQALVDTIHASHKPSEGKYIEGELEGTKRHLDDLRRLLGLKKIEVGIEKENK
jgi:hypothetical protein